MPNKSDILRIQYALFHGAKSCDLFDNINIVLERQLLANAEVDYDTIWQMPRNGKSGAGILVECPKLRVENPNSLQRDLLFSMVVVGDPNMILLADTGTGKQVEEWAEDCLDFMWNWMLANTSGLKPERNAIVRAEDFVNSMALRATVSVRVERTPRTRVLTPAIAAAGLNVTLTCATAGAAIYYTTDGFSMPAPANDGSLPGTQAATLYTVPFAVASGSVVMACAFKAGQNPSQISGATIN